MTTTNFKQTKKVGTAGSFQNQMMSNNSSIPVVGKGATQMHYTDRTCFEVVEVSADNKTARLMYLKRVADILYPFIISDPNCKLEQTDKFVTITYRDGAWRTIGTEVTYTEAFTKEAADKGFIFESEYLQTCYPHLVKKVYGNKLFPQNVVSGITEAKKVYNKINIIFGIQDINYDYQF